MKLSTQDREALRKFFSRTMSISSECSRCGHINVRHSHKPDPGNPYHVGELPNSCSDCSTCATVARRG